MKYSEIHWGRRAILFVLRFALFAGAVKGLGDFRQHALALDVWAVGDLAWALFCYSGFSGLERAISLRDAHWAVRRGG